MRDLVIHNMTPSFTKKNNKTLFFLDGVVGDTQGVVAAIEDNKLRLEENVTIDLQT